MTLELIAFGIVKDIIGGKTLKIVVKEGTTVKELKYILTKKFPKIEGLASLMVAINQEYADLDIVIRPTDEIVLIPPVSGG